MMSDAIVLLRLWNPAQLEGAFPADRVRRLADGAATVRLTRPFRELCGTPASTSELVRRALGPLADAVKDQRGVFVYPEACDCPSPTYEQLLGAIGPAGFWVVVDDEVSPDAPRSASQFSKTGWRPSPTSTRG